MPAAGRSAGTNAASPPCRTWHHVRQLLRRAKLYTPASCIDEAQRNRLTPDFVCRMVEFYLANRQAWGSPYMIRLAVQQISPDEAPDDFDNWPPVRAEFAAAQRNRERAAAEARQREEEQERERLARAEAEALEEIHGPTLDLLDSEALANLSIQAGLDPAHVRRRGIDRGGLYRLPLLKALAAAAKPKPK